MVWASRKHSGAAHGRGLHAAGAVRSDLEFQYCKRDVLSAADGRWLAIDPKPLIGEPAYDLAQYLANRVEAAIATRRPAEELSRQVRFFARALDLDPTRVARWAAVKAVGWDWGPSTAALLTQVADQM